MTISVGEFGEKLLEVLEAARKPGVMSTAGQKRERICAKDLERYFRILGDQVEEANLGALAIETHVEAARHAGEMKIRSILRKLQPLLMQTISTNLYLAALEGSKVAERFKLKEADPQTQPTRPVLTGVDILGLSGQAAADWAAKQSSLLVTNIDRTTLEILQAAITQGIEEQLGTAGLGRLIRNTVLEMTTYRSQMIATTEMNNAFSETALRKMQANGYQFKRWLTSPDACDECVDLDEEVVPVDEPFSAGVDRPPLHPNCRCAIVPARGEDTAA